MKHLFLYLPSDLLDFIDDIGLIFLFVFILGQLTENGDDSSKEEGENENEDIASLQTASAMSTKLGKKKKKKKRKQKEITAAAILPEKVSLQKTNLLHIIKPYCHSKLFISVAVFSYLDFSDLTLIQQNFVLTVISIRNLIDSI